MTKQKQSKYSELSDTIKTKIVRRVERDRIKRKLWAIRYKGGECQKCGYNKCIGALDFHHIDPSTKEAGWPQMRKMSKENIIKELDKCILVCSNCHREIHYTQTDEFLKEMIVELDQLNGEYPNLPKKRKKDE